MADYYVDPSKTNGSGSIGSPFNSLNNALTAATGSNDRIFLARGYVYAKLNTSYGGRVISKTPTIGLYVGAYTASDSPNGMNPTFNAMTFEAPGASGWSLVQAGTGVWKKAYAASGTNVTVWRVFTGARLTGPSANNAQGTGYVLGTARARVPVAYNATEATVMANINSMGSVAPRLWAHINQPSGFLYIYTGSDTLDPPTFYNGLGIVGGDASTWGCYEGFTVYDSQRITVEHIDAIGATGPNHHITAGGFSVDTTDIVFNDCNGYAHAQFGIQCDGLAQSTPRFVQRVQIKNSTFDSVATLAEDWNFRTGTGISWLNGAQDDIRVNQRCNGIEFTNCTVKDGYHTCAVVETLGVAAIDNVVFRDCIFTAYNRLYGHGLATGGVTSTCLFDRCTFAGMTQWFQVQGGKTQIRNCLFYDAMPPYPSYNGQNNVNSEPACSVGTLSAVYPTMAAGDLVVENCTFMQAYGFMWQIYSRSSGSLTDGFAIVRNNVFIDTQYLQGPGRSISTSLGPDPGTSIYYALNNGETTPSMTFTNNYYYTGTSGQNLIAEQRNASITRKTLSTMTGASNNSEANPMLTFVGYRPAAGSPLISSGTFIRNDNDVSRLPRGNPPTIGAYER